MYQVDLPVNMKPDGYFKRWIHKVSGANKNSINLMKRVALKDMLSIVSGITFCLCMLEFDERATLRVRYQK